MLFDKGRSRIGSFYRIHDVVSRGLLADFTWIFGLLTGQDSERGSKAVRRVFDLERLVQHDLGKSLVAELFSTGRAWEYQFTIMCSFEACFRSRHAAPQSQFFGKECCTQ